MCLACVQKIDKPFVICWKVFFNLGNGKLVGPYHSSRQFKVGKKYRATIRYSTNHSYLPAFHAFYTRESARKYIKECYRPNSYVIKKVKLSGRLYVGDFATWTYECKCYAGSIMEILE